MVMGSTAFVHFKIATGSEIIIIFCNIIYTTPIVQKQNVTRCQEKDGPPSTTYRTRATNSRSQIMAASLGF